MPAMVSPLAVLGPGSCHVTVRERCGPQSASGVGVGQFCGHFVSFSLLIGG